MAVLTINIERLGQPGDRNEPDGGEAEGKRRLITGRSDAVGAWGMINSERSCLPLTSRLVAATTDRNAKSATRRKPIVWLTKILAAGLDGKRVGATPKMR